MTSTYKTLARRALGVCLLGALLTCGAACGDEDAGRQPQVTPSNNSPGKNNATNNNTNGTTGAIPAAVDLELEDRRAFYAPEATINLIARALDRSGAVMPDAALTWAVEPAGAAVQGDGGAWTLKAEGLITLTACAEAAPTLCASERVLVDAQPPTITLTSPVGGSELSPEDGDLIAVEGVVTDTRGDLFVTVNGQAVTLDAEGKFATTVRPVFGVNHVEVFATDGVRRASVSKAADVLYAPSYHAPIDDPTVSAVTHDDGIRLRLGQTFMDDGRAPVVTPDGAAFTEDLADILIVLLRTIDFAALFPNPLVDTGDVSVTVPSVSLGNPRLSIRITEGGLELYLSTTDLTIDTRGQLGLADQTLNLDGTITAAVSVLAHARIDKPSADEPFDISIETIEVAIQDATSQFDDAQANAIFALARSALRVQVESVLTAGLESSFLDTIPGVLSDGLNGLEEGLSMQSFDLDLGFGGTATTLDFQGKINALTLTPLRDATMVMATTITAQSPPVHTSRGVATMAAQPAPPELFESSRIQLAVRLGVLNGLLHSLWRTGLLDIDVSTLLPPEAALLLQGAVTEAKLPPVIVPPDKGQDYDAFLRIGQFMLVADYGTVKATYGLSLGAGVRMGLDDNQLKIEIAQTPELSVWLDSVEGQGDPRLSADQVRDLLQSKLWPELTRSISQGLSLNLPVIDLSSLSSYSPALADFTLSFDQVRPIVLRDDHLIIDSRLRGTLPPPVAAP